MLVKLHNRDQKMSILTARKQLKHSGLRVAENLTKQNVELLNRLKNYHRMESTWSWNNKLYAKGINRYNLSFTRMFIYRDMTYSAISTNS